MEDWHLIASVIATGLLVVGAIRQTTKGLRDEIHSFRAEVVAFGKEVTRLSTVLGNLRESHDGSKERLNAFERRIDELEQFKAAMEVKLA